MSARTHTVRIEPPRSRAVQSVKDSLVVARRNLIRMTRIPNLVRSVGSRFHSSGSLDRRPSAGKGCPA
ncbi:integral membrane transport protein [Streptomyces sp. NPDC023723]|uniref:integral membrane transport protein n=1 Tax=Streptomyces sp. NPDC023723 TaxID=3154323 RepID=UPI0033EA066A